MEDRCLLSYSVFDLGAFTGYGLNNAGQVVGTGPVLWQNGNLNQFGAGTWIGTAYAINDAGQVAGYGSSGAVVNHAYRWDANLGFTDLGTLPNRSYSLATDLNEAGQVVGASKQINSSYALDGASAFLWDATNGMQDLGFSIATAINESGQIVGYSQYSMSTGWTVYATQDVAYFRDSSGVPTPLGTLPGQPYSKSLDINDLGQVVGSSGDAQWLPHSLTYRPQEAFLWQNGVMTGLGKPAGVLRTEAVAINNASQVLCIANPANYPSYSGRAYLWENGVWTDLGFSYVSAADINELGQILLVASSGNQNHSYLLTPDTMPGLRISDVSVTEGDTGAMNVVFTVTRSGALDQSTTVNFTTADGTALAGKDFAAISGTLTFAPGETSQTITVAVLGDTVDEYDETFSVRLSNASNVFLADGHGSGTITDNDPPPTLTISDVALKEGRSGVSYFVFTVSLSAASGKPVSLSYATADGTATVSDNDYVATAGTLTFAAGETTKTITVAVNGDRKKEANESFSLNLSGAINADLLHSQGLGTILNDD